VFKLTDESLHNEAPIGVNVFAPELSDLPPVTGEGDVVRLHRVKHFTANNMVGNTGKGGGFAVVVVPRSAPGTPIRRLAVPSSHTWTEADSARVDQLRALYAASRPTPVLDRGPMQTTLHTSADAASRPATAATTTTNTNTTTTTTTTTTTASKTAKVHPLLARLRSSASETGTTLLTDCSAPPQGTQSAKFDLIGKVLQVSHAGDRRKLLVYLWDGTGDVGDNQPWGLTAQSPAIGVVLKFAIWDQRLFPMFQVNELTGAWVVVHSCVCKRYFEETELCTFKQATAIALLDDNDPRVLQRLAFAESRLAQLADDDVGGAAQVGDATVADTRAAEREAARRTAAASGLARRNNNVLTRVLHVDAPVSTLRQVLECEQAVWCFRVRACVTAVLPTVAVHFCRPFCTACNELLAPARVRLMADERAAALDAERQQQLIGGGTTFVVPRVGQKRALDADDAGNDDNALAPVQPPLDACPSCAQVPSEWRYMVALRLRDATASLDVTLVGDDAVDFFDDVPAGDLRQNNCSRNVLEKKLSALMLPNQLVDFCLKSFEPAPLLSGTASTSSSQLPPITRVYRVFDTVTTFTQTN
jgi:hypothetical protein